MKMKTYLAQDGAHQEWGYQQGCCRMHSQPGGRTSARTRCFLCCSSFLPTTSHRRHP